ncbi:MAG: riboflavin biosynthesis protein RibF [Saprospiraceae bacterium]|nr:riboflavin biosynthesis protein RibF [Saprospiraceae bacterium]
MRVHADLSNLPVFRNAVLTIGSFDGVHLGHQRILEQLKQLARSSAGETVVVTFDPHPRTVLKPDDASFKLISTTTEKAALLAAAGIDHLVIVPFNASFSQMSADEYVSGFLIKNFHPKFVVIGYDHRFGNNREGNIEFLKKYETAGDFKVVEIPAHEVDELAVSSSKIRKALEAAQISWANKLLGHPFSFSGQVIYGDQIGRTIGFPTANIEISDPYKLMLPFGIYAATVTLPNGHTYNSALYIGNRPTVHSNGKPVIEVNLFEFDGDLYGQTLHVKVLQFIRPDKKLDGLPALQQQIAADKTAILQYMNLQPAPTDTAIVILNYNTRKHLQQYLPSVLAHAGGARVIVADNGSPDDSIEVLRRDFPEVEILDLQQNHGFAQGYNEALRQVNAEIYVILNSDVEVAPGWMEPVLTALRDDPKLAVAQPKILQWEPDVHQKTPKFEHAGAAGGWIDWLGYPFCRGRIFSQRESDLGQYDTPQECFWAAGAAFFIRADLYHKFDGFDGDYFAHNEEIDLCWRLKRAGYSVKCIPQSVVYHLGGGTLEYENPRKVYLNFRNSLYSLIKNEPWGKLLWLIPARFLLDGLAGARFAAKGQVDAIWAIVRAHFSFYGTFQETLKKRKEVASIIERHRIGPENRHGVYRGSMIVAHYLRRVKKFSDLPAIFTQQPPE